MPIIGVEHEPSTHRLAVISRQASGIRLHELLRGAHDREIVPDMGASLYIAAQILTAAHAFHSLSGLPHGTLNPHHVVMSPDGELQITDYAFAEVIEAANFSRERLWHELHIAAWMGSDVFSFQADVRQAALIAMALMVGRPLDGDNLTMAIDTLLSEVEEAAMIRGGRLFADPVGAWLVKALGAGSSEGFADARAAADACAELLTDRERSEAARALPQLIEAITEPLPETSVSRAPAVESVPEPASTLSTWPESAIVNAEPPQGETDTEGANLHEGEPLVVDESAPPVDEIAPPVDQSVIDHEAPAPVFDETPAPVFDSAPEEPAAERWATEPPAAPEFVEQHAEEQVEEPATVASEPEPVAASEEPERRGKKRKKRRGRRGGVAETPTAPQPPASAAAPSPLDTQRPLEPIPHTPWVPASTTKAPTTEESQGVSSASPFAILNRSAAETAPSPTAVPVETGSSQFSARAVIETNISQPQRGPAPPSSVAAPGVEAPQAIRLKSATGQPEAPTTIRLKSQVEDPGTSTGIRLKEQPPSTRQRTMAAQSIELPQEPVERGRSIPRHLWKYVAAVIVVVVAGVAAVTMKITLGGKDIAPGTLVIETTPAGSQVFVDGDAKGVTPASVKLPPGRHEVKLTRKNASHSWTVEVASGARRVERLDWSALFSTGGVEIVSNNPGAKVLVDGKPRGEIPITITDLTPGRHVILAQSPSGNVRRTVTIVAGETTKLDLAIYSGWLVVGSPIELDVAENGKVIGQAGQGPLVLPAGRHRIDLVNATYGYRSSHEVEIRPGEEERIVENPAGVLNVNATPWAEVWVDGTRAGETPLANVKVPLGTREILFKHPQFGEKRMIVTVTAKEPVQLAIDMTKPQ